MRNEFPVIYVACSLLAAVGIGIWIWWDHYLAIALLTIAAWFGLGTLYDHLRTLWKKAHANRT